MKKSKNYNEVEVLSEPTILTGDEILDNFLSTNGGFVKRSSIFLTGTSGAGKTTFVAHLQKIFGDIKSSFYSREMTASSVKAQTIGMKINHKNAYICDINDCSTVEAYIKELDELKPDIVMVDSLQVIAYEDFPSENVGSVEFDIIQKLRKWVDENDAVLIVIGHVTKEGEFRGNNTLIQMFDAHLEMKYDKKTNTRIMSWGSKNRKGPLGMIYYEITKAGVKFYTTEQWERIKGKKNLDGFIDDAVKSYILSLDRKNANFSEFKKEYNRRVDFFQNELSGLDLTIACAHLLEECIEKYNIK